MPYANREDQRAAERRYHERNPKVGRGTTRRLRAKRRELLQARKSEPCVDCGGRYHHSAMDFDHRPGEAKVRQVSHMQTNSLTLLEAEIAKCDLVCANCHRVRTYNRVHDA